MSFRKALPSIATIAVCAALTAPLLSAKDKAIPPVDDPYVEAEVPEKMPGMIHRGYGQGSIELPTFAENGEMIGVLTDSDGPGEFLLRAELTGCIPLNHVIAEPCYWFGGLYGQMTKLPASDEYRSHTVTYYVEGMWYLDKYLTGRFEAQLWRFGPDGLPFVAGLMDGKFCVHPFSLELPDEPWSDAAPPDKGFKTSYGDARSGPPWRDAAPDKVKDAFDDARSAEPWGDVAPDKVKDPFGDVGSRPTKDVGKGPYGNAWTTRPWVDVSVATPKGGEPGPGLTAKAVKDKPTPPWTDVRPDHKGWRDAGSQPFPLLVGNFGARFGCFCE